VEPIIIKCRECKRKLHKMDLEKHMRARHAPYFADVQRWLRYGRKGDEFGGTQPNLSLRQDKRQAA